MIRKNSVPTKQKCCITKNVRYQVAYWHLKSGNLKAQPCLDITLDSLRVNTDVKKEKVNLTFKNKIFGCILSLYVLRVRGEIN